MKVFYSVIPSKVKEFGTWHVVGLLPLPPFARVPYSSRRVCKSLFQILSQDAICFHSLLYHVNQICILQMGLGHLFLTYTGRCRPFSLGSSLWLTWQLIIYGLIHDRPSLLELTMTPSHVYFCPRKPGLMRVCTIVYNGSERLKLLLHEHRWCFEFS